VPTRLTRYMLWEIAKPFGFFVIVFTAVIWLTQALRVLDTVVANGQTARVFLEFSALLLPVVMSIALPISAFGATLYAVNRMLSESEIVAMLAAGLGGLAIARPAAIFGAAVTLVMAVTTLYLQPTAAQTLRTRIAEVRADIANALIFEGRFLHPGDGLTVFVRETGQDGAMRGVFVHDRRDPEAEITYTAREALLTRGEEGPRLVMFDGSAQRASDGPEGLSLLRFESLVFDLAPFMEAAENRTPRPSERYAYELIAPTAEQLGGFSLGRFVAEGHEQISSPLYALALPLVAVAASLAAGFTRRGYATRLGVGAALGIGLRVVGLAAKSATTANAALWPLMYAPPILGAAAALWVLSGRGWPLFRRRAAA
jgi:lipopolysaccharide export system permease protein